MINHTEHYLAWVLLMDGLDEAKEHLDGLTKVMATNGRIDEAEVATYLGHVYAHPTRAWNGRNLAAEATDEQRIQFTQFPTDLLPVG